MNLDKNTKSILHGLGITLVLAGTILTMLYPEKLNYRYSMKDIESKNGQLQDLENNINSNNTSIPMREKELEEARKSLIERKNEIASTKINFPDEKLRFHLPSLLITLEQGAVDAGISPDKFYLEYDLIKTNQNNSNSAPTDPSEGQSPGGASSDGPPNRPGRPGNGESESTEEYPVGEAEVIPSAPQAPETPSNETPVEEGQIESPVVDDLSVAYAQDEVPVIRGISVTTVPLKLISVSYTEAREYLSFLDKLDFVEPSFVDIYSESGENISVIILVHVFHKGGGIDG